MVEDAFAEARERMLTEQIVVRGIRDERILGAMRAVPRHAFVPPDQQSRAYQDSPLPIGHQQTISQPFIVALMTVLVRPSSTDRALEIGTGCGYQSAVLAQVVAEVFSIETIDALARDAQERLVRLGYATVHVRLGDGYDGWPDRAPFDIVIVTAAPPQVPQTLIAQLAPGGRMAIPVGPSDAQVLQLIEKGRDGQVTTRDVAPVRFVPMVETSSRA
ncbi:MAG TPA: protein-L-isoaspartate(D-aspartate) O-methyltransferase [Vicinamibacterales bacterium]|jgi:protein-L-isoaspartate(D-aspartate) O-methyltransferase